MENDKNLTIKSKKTMENDIISFNFDTPNNISIWKEISILSNCSGGRLSIYSSLVKTKDLLSKFKKKIPLYLSPNPILEFEERLNENGKIFINVRPSSNLVLCKEKEGTFLYKKNGDNYIKLNDKEAEEIKKDKWNKFYCEAFIPVKFNPSNFEKLAIYYENNSSSFNVKTLSEDNLINEDSYVSFGLSLFSKVYNDLTLIILNSNLSQPYPSIKTIKGNVLEIFDSLSNLIEAKRKDKLDDNLRKEIRAVTSYLLSILDYKNNPTLIFNEYEDILVLSIENAVISDVNPLVEKTSYYNKPILKIMHKIGLLDLNYLCSILNEDKISLDGSSFTIKLIKQNNSIKDSKIELNYQKLQEGNRNYDDEILSFCLNGPKTREEICKLTPYKSKSSFLVSVLNPLLEAKLLLPTTSFKTSPNNKYFTNLDKVKRKDGHQ